MWKEIKIGVCYIFILGGYKLYLWCVCMCVYLCMCVCVSTHVSMCNGSLRIPFGRSLLPCDPGDGMGWDAGWRAQQTLTCSARSLALMYSYVQTVLDLNRYM